MKNESELSVQAFDYVQLAFEKYHNHQVNGCIKLNGQIDIKILEQAVNSTVQDFPQLVSKFSKGEYEKSKSRLKVELIKSRSLQLEVDKVMAESLNIEEGPQVRIAVVRSEKQDAVVIVMSHLLCDGMSLKRYMYLICSLYNSLLEGSKVSHPYAGKKRGIDWLKKCSLPDEKRIKPNKEEQIKFHEGKNKLFAKCWLDKKYYKNIRAYIKEKNVTMNDLIMAVYYKAVREEFNYSLKSICCAMDLRRYIDNKDAYGLCNQTGNGYTTIENAEKMEFEELLQEVHKQMEKEKEHGLSLKQVKVLEKAFRMLPHSISKRLIKLFISNPQAALTNLGKIDRDKVTFKGLETTECYISPSLKRAPNFQMAVSTFEDNILLMVNMIVDRQGKEKIERFLRRCADILQNIVEDR